jgi:magnesium transporter
MAQVEKTEEINGKCELFVQRNNVEEFEKRWFCVAVCSDGRVFMDDADSVASFLEPLHEATIAWVDYRTGSKDFDKDARLAATLLGFSDQLISSLSKENHSLYEDLDTEMGLKLPSIQIRTDESTDVQAHTTLLFLKKNFILTIHSLDVDRRFKRLRRYSDRILKRIPVELPPEDKLTTLLIRIIDQNNDRNFEHLRQIEEQGDQLNKKLMNPETPRALLGPEIYGMKHALITYLNALWETVDVVHDVRYGDADLITSDIHLLERVGLLSTDVNNQIGLAEHLSEVLASGLEVLQSIYNNQLQVLNNRMALIMTYLTVLGTAVLVPNTLATIFSNSAFDMGPKDVGWYSVLLIVSTIISTGLALWWVRRSKGIPKKID